MRLSGRFAHGLIPPDIFQLLVFGHKRQKTCRIMAGFLSPDKFVYHYWENRLSGGPDGTYTFAEISCEYYGLNAVEGDIYSEQLFKINNNQ
jgi:hypothetical protein